MTARGDSLIEVVVALMLLSVGALAVAAGIGHARRARHLAEASGIALAAAEAWMEGWRAGPPRGATAGGGTVSWGAWSLEVEWETAAPSACVEAARVSVSPGSEVARAALSGRRSLVGTAHCGP